MGVGQQGRRPADEQSHVGAACPIETAMFEQAGVERRNAHERRGARQRLNDRVGVKAVMEDHLRPRQQRDIDGDEQAMRVENRQGVDERVVRREAPQIDERERVGEQIALRDHRAL